VADEIDAEARQHDQSAWRIAGLESAQWVLLDFVDVVVHLFDAEHRHYYDLEILWGDAPRVQWRRPAGSDAPEGGE
jgi:ribosome-associated protein